MKDKSDNHSHARLANIKQAAAEAGLPERIKLPGPVALAQIAAGFGSQARPADAVRRAVSLYLRATAFKAKHDNAPVLDVARVCDDELASQLGRAAMMVPFERTHLLKRDARQDEARRFLAENGLRLRKAKAVLKNLRQLRRLDHLDGFLRNQKIPVTWKGKPLWAWGAPTASEHGDDQTKLNEALKAKCRMVTRTEYDKQKEAIAKKHGWREAEAEREWKQELAGMIERQPDGRTAHRLPEMLLTGLIWWKRSIKRTGGVRSRHAKKTAEIS